MTSLSAEILPCSRNNQRGIESNNERMSCQHSSPYL